MVWNLVTLQTACQANFATDSRRTFKKFFAALECLRDGRKKRKTEIISSANQCHEKYLWSPRPSRYEQLLPPKIVDSMFSPENSCTNSAIPLLCVEFLAFSLCERSKLYLRSS